MSVTEASSKRVTLLAIIATAFVLAGCTVPTIPGGSDGGTGGGGSGLLSIDDKTIRDGSVLSFPLSTWTNSGSYALTESGGLATDNDGDNQMEAVITGSPDPTDLYPITDLDPGLTYSSTSVSGYDISGFDVETDGGYIALYDYGNVNSTNQSNFTGPLYLYEFWWVDGDVGISGTTNVNG